MKILNLGKVEEETNRLGGGHLMSPALVEAVMRPAMIDLGDTDLYKMRDLVPDRYDTMKQAPRWVPDLKFKKRTASEMFANCRHMQSAPAPNTALVTRMAAMFAWCYDLATVPPLETGNVTDMTLMFVSCSSLVSVPALNTSRVTLFNEMFGLCSELKTVPWLDTSRAEKCYQMFYGCSALESVPAFDLSSCWLLNGMFRSCSSLKTARLLNMQKMNWVEYMFKGCSSLETVAWTGAEASGHYFIQTAMGMFSGCHALKTVPELNLKRVGSFVTDGFIERDEGNKEYIEYKFPAFKGNLQAITPADCVEGIFDGCDALRAVTIKNAADGVKSYLTNRYPNITFTWK